MAGLAYKNRNTVSFFALSQKRRQVGWTMSQLLHILIMFETIMLFES